MPPIRRWAVVVTTFGSHTVAAQAEQDGQDGWLQLFIERMSAAVCTWIAAGSFFHGLQRLKPLSAQGFPYLHAHSRCSLCSV